MRSMFFAAMFALCVPFAALSHTVDLSVSDDAFRLAYEGDVAPAAGGMMRADAGILHNSDEGDLVHLGLKVHGNAGGYTMGVEGALGATLYGASIDAHNKDVSALALTGELYLTPQELNRVRLALTASYAPEVLTFGDGKSLLDTAARLEYEVLNETRAYVGYRLSRVDLDQYGHEDLEQGAQIGLNVTF